MELIRLIFTSGDDDVKETHELEQQGRPPVSVFASSLETIQLRFEPPAILGSSGVNGLSLNFSV